MCALGAVRAPFLARATPCARSVPCALSAGTGRTARHLLGRTRSGSFRGGAEPGRCARRACAAVTCRWRSPAARYLCTSRPHRRPRFPARDPAAAVLRERGPAWPGGPPFAPPEPGVGQGLRGARGRVPRGPWEAAAGQHVAGRRGPQRAGPEGSAFWRGPGPATLGCASAAETPGPPAPLPAWAHPGPLTAPAMGDRARARSRTPLSASPSAPASGYGVCA